MSTQARSGAPTCAQCGYSGDDVTLYSWIYGAEHQVASICRDSVACVARINESERVRWRVHLIAGFASPYWSAVDVLMLTATVALAMWVKGEYAPIVIFATGALLTVAVRALERWWLDRRC